MAENNEQHRILTEQKTQLTAELTALSDSMDKVCRCPCCQYLWYDTAVEPGGSRAGPGRVQKWSHLNGPGSEAHDCYFDTATIVDAMWLCAHLHTFKAVFLISLAWAVRRVSSQHVVLWIIAASGYLSLERSYCALKIELELKVS